MKILFTSTYFHPYVSGLSDYPLKIGSYLGKKHKVSVLTFRHLTSLPTIEQYRPRADQPLADNNITICRISPHLRILKGMINLLYPLISLWYVWRNDVIFINIPQIEGKFPAFWGWLLRKKVYTIYHCELAFNSGVLYTIAEVVAHASHFLVCLFSTKIIVYSKDYARSALFLKFFSSKILEILPPVELGSIDRKYLNYLIANSQQPTAKIGFSGRISHEKGIEYLLEAIKLLKDKHPNIHLYLAGPYGKDVVGEEKYYKKIMSLVSGSRLQVSFLGKLSKSQLSAFYSFIDVLVLPSINKTEAFGMVQVEALLSGTPVVASNLPGVRVPIQLTKWGYISEVKNPESLATQIDKALHLKKESAPRQDILNIFNISHTYAFYDTLIS